MISLLGILMGMGSLVYTLMIIGTLNGQPPHSTVGEVAQVYDHAEGDYENTAIRIL